MGTDLVLASGSPRRRQLLEQLGLSFTVIKPDVDESVLPGEDPGDYVVRLSAEKAAAVQQKLDRPSVVLAADTTVEIDGNILGKPGSKQEGVAMLEQLSGSEHLVLTGVTVTDGNRDTSLCVKSRVRFRQLSATEMDYYWETGEPVDKAGGYGLQGIGAVFVESINGSYTNVIGLPLPETVMLLRKYGVTCLGEPTTEGAEELFVVEGSRND